MHWLLDVHFGEDYFRVANRSIQENVNMLRKFALSLMKRYKAKTSSKQAMSPGQQHLLFSQSVI